MTSQDSKQQTYCHSSWFRETSIHDVTRLKQQTYCHSSWFRETSIHDVTRLQAADVLSFFVVPRNVYT
ncbi:hypothetical protein DPMN_164682 [Dreissena polymorpha]|uniref:Uncharacterized protein n=1 Tax=Dreissena polymorpha TaxID=45954 RepID=A0A9D4ITX7_DREPO|nr:hypothetical protein DPMN_164682 [Dreissena polymorpha]